MKKCIFCKNQIPAKDLFRHKQFDDMLNITDPNKSLTRFCAKCVKSLMDTNDVLNKPAEEFDYRGCNAKLNCERILEKPKGKQERYLQFVRDNKDKEFTLKIREESKDNKKLEQQLIAGRYEFEEIDDMFCNFHVADLIISDKNKKIPKIT